MSGWAGFWLACGLIISTMGSLLAMPPEHGGKISLDDALITYLMK